MTLSELCKGRIVDHVNKWYMHKEFVQENEGV